MMAGYESQLDAITQKSDALGIPRSQVIRVYSEAFEAMIKDEKVTPDVFRRYCTELAIWQALCEPNSFQRLEVKLTQRQSLTMNPFLVSTRQLRTSISLVKSETL